MSIEANGTKSKGITCAVCGRFRAGPFRGRVPDYCSASCREYAKYMGAAARLLDQIRPDRDHAKRIRSELFTMANQVSRG